jgi:4-hydroxy-4-methyl-2-oxoglutarate aldolase
MYEINKRIRRPDASLVAQAAKIGAATLHEAYGKRGAVNRTIRPIHSGMKICGPALTVECYPGDNIGLHIAIALAEPGDVLVATTSGNPDFGYWGEIMAIAALQRGIAGLAISGCVRDSVEICRMQFPVFAEGLFINGAKKEIFRSINMPILFGDIELKPGDLVVGDDDGLVIIDQSEVPNVIEHAIHREAREKLMIEEIKKGATTLQVLGLTQILKRQNISI